MGLEVEAERISIHALLAESDWRSQSKTAEPKTFLSTLSLRRATFGLFRLRRRNKISIHALLAESDGKGEAILPAEAGISIHALLAESDVDGPVAASADLLISIHALLAESDSRRNSSDVSALSFLSTLSLRRATRLHPLAEGDPGISIHALLAESDR